MHAVRQARGAHALCRPRMGPCFIARPAELPLRRLPALPRLQVIADSMKAYVAFEKKLIDALPKEERATARPIDIRCARGACLD